MLECLFLLFMLYETQYWGEQFMELESRNGVLFPVYAVYVYSILVYACAFVVDKVKRGGLTPVFYAWFDGWQGLAPRGPEGMMPEKKGICRP